MRPDPSSCVEQVPCVAAFDVLPLDAYITERHSGTS